MKIVDGADESNGIPDESLAVLAQNNNGSADTYSTKQLSMAFAGGGLTPTQITNLTTYYNAAMTALGKNVF